MNFANSKIMVLDTEYETSPKRLLSLAYIIYENGKKVVKENMFINHNKPIVNEFGEAFKIHKLSNKFLKDNGIPIIEVLNKLSNDLNDISIIVGQNIMTADIQIIRKEGIGVKLWFNNLRDKLLNIKIYDTMKAFKNLHNDKSASLNNIYKFLMNKEMKDHHDALHDCKNTYKCYIKMKEDDDYIFNEQKINYPEDMFDSLNKVKISCNICNSKICDDHTAYILNKLDYCPENSDKKYKILNHNDILKIDKKICKKCFSQVELIIYHKDEFSNMVKLKSYDQFIKYFFEVKGPVFDIYYLISDFKDKDVIKKLGGRWDGRKRKWYCRVKDNDKQVLKKFSKWLPK